MLSWRLRRARVSHATCFFDVESAFGSVAHDEAVMCASVGMDAHAVDCLREHVVCAEGILQCSDGPLSFKPRVGVFAGSAIGTAVLNSVYWQGLESLSARLAVADRSLIVSSPLTGRALYVGMSSFVDDVACKVTSETAVALPQRVLRAAS